MLAASSPEPSGLNQAEAAERAKLVAALGTVPAEAQPMLCQLSRHIVQARWLGRALQKARELPSLHLYKSREINRVFALSRAHDREGKAVMRLTLALQSLTRGARVVDAATLFRKAAS